MRRILLSISVLFFFQVVFADTYGFPDKKRPEVSLKDACQIAEDMLRSQGHEKRFFANGVLLYGDKEQTGKGAWNILYSDSSGTSVIVHIPFPVGNPVLNYSKSGKEKTVEFVRKGTKVRKVTKGDKLKNEKPNKEVEPNGST